jgi:phage shock protein E
MPVEIDRAEVRRRAKNGALLVEVLPGEEYEAEHLPGAISLPLSDLDRQSVARFDADQPIIVYCNDQQ